MRTVKKCLSSYDDSAGRGDEATIFKDKYDRASHEVYEKTKYSGRGFSGEIRPVRDGTSTDPILNGPFRDDSPPDGPERRLVKPEPAVTGFVEQKYSSQGLGPNL